MICKKQIKINGNIVDSELYPTILKIMKDNPHLVLDEVNSFIDNPLDSINDLKENHYEQVADLMYNYFEDSSFIDEFGDWMNNNELSVNKYDNGEPRLFYDKNLNKHYYRNKYNDKIYFPLNDNGLNYIYDDETLEEGVKYIANVFFKSNFNEDYNDLSFTTDESFKENIRQILMMKINEFSGTDKNDLAEDLRDSLYYLNEWEDRVRNYFDSLGFKVEESDVEIQNLEENDTQELVRRSSIEQDSKNNISANVKAFLSFIPDNRSIDYMFMETGFIEFEDIYNTLQDGLSDISPTIVEDNVEDTFNIMINRIGELAHRKPYLKELLNILNNPSLSDSKKSQFTQAFSLVKNPYFVTEVDFKSKGLSFTAKDVSNVNANYNIINREWGFNFEANFLEDKVLNLPKLLNIKDNIKLVRSDFDKLRRTITDASELEGIINNTINILNDLGIETTEQGFNDYINNLEDTVINIDELLNNVNKILSTSYKFIDGINNKTVFYRDNKYINPLNKESLFKKLAKSEAFYKPDGSDATIFSSGKSYWVYSLPSHLVGEVNKWKSNIQELELLYNSDNGNGSKVLQYLLAYDQDWLRESERIEEAERRINKYKVGIFNALQNKKTDKVKSDPKNNVELSKDDAIIDSINRALLHNKDEQSLYNTPTPADKLTSYLLSHGYFLKTNISEMKDGKPIFSSEVINTYYDYFSAEYDRMNKAALVVKDENSRKTMYFHTGKSGKLYEGGKLAGNAFKSQIFEGLSHENINKVLPEIGNLIYNKDGSPALKSLDKYENEIKDYINSILQDSIINKINVLEANGVLIKDDSVKGGYIAKGIDESIMKHYNSNYSLPIHNAIADYHLNTMLNNIEYSKMFSGDPAYYKDMIDYAKRIPATYTDGLQLRLKNNDDLTFNAAIISGVKISSRNLDNLKKLVGEDIANMYANKAINATDAQAWITPDRWKFLLDRLGLWTDLHESAFPKMMGTSKEPFDEKELKAVAQPLKGVYFKLNNGVPTYLKYSQAVLLPGLIEGSDLQKMYDKMIENEIDEVITLDGIKVGAPIPDTIHTEEGFIKDEFNLTPIQFDNRGWKLQQNLTTKTFKDTDVGSQIQKNALSGLAFNLDSEFTYEDKKLTGLELYKELNNIVGALSNNGKESLLNELEIDSTGKINNIGSLYNLILKEAKKKNINDNLIKALEKEISIYGIPQSHTKLMNMFFSIVKDRLVKIKTNGGSFIQVSNFGIDKLTKGIKREFYKGNITPEEDTVFVFGSNPEGRHGAGAAKVAKEKFGAIYGQGEGLQNNAYALPTKDLRIKENKGFKSISEETITESIKDLYKVAKNNPKKKFKIAYRNTDTKSLNGYTGLEMIQMFKDAGYIPSNIIFSEEWIGTGLFDETKLDATGIKWFIDPENGLKPPHIIENEDGKEVIKPGQILLPGSLISKYIPNWKEIPADKLKEMIDPEILENIIGYRIPNQGLSSNDALEIVGFLPEGMGDAVVAYSEIPTKTGSDFDIDKMYMMIPSFTFENNRLIYPKENTNLPLNEQSKEVLQNKLIEAYKAIFTHPKVIRDVMTPIDFDYIKNDINSIFKDSSSKPDLHHFDSINQINLKYDFLAGKAGVGQTANMLVDHVRGMFIEMSLINTYIGRGHQNDENETLFDREYSEDLTQEDLDYYSKKYKKSKDEIKNYKISNSISAFLNAFVDIAKDPYVTRGNWTTQTSNVGFMMLRAGIHPYIVNRFIGQPIIKEYINFVTNAESKFKNEKGNIRTLFLDDYTKKHNLDKNTFSKFDVNNLTLKELDGLIKNYNPNKQLKIVEKFFTLQDNSKKLIESINASKPDVTGAGKDLSSRFIIENLISELKNNEINEVSGSLRGFSNKLIDPKTGESTILGHYVDNSIDWTNTVLKANPKIFLLGNKNVENTFNILSNELRGSKLLNQDIADTLYKDFYSYLMSGFNGLKTENPALNLFVKLPKEVSIAKQEDDYNFFLQQLELIEEDGITFIRLQNKKRSKNIQNKLYRGWKTLMEDRPELSKNLIKYSYYQSGFQNNINEFFNHIPHEYFVETKLNQYIYEVNNELNDVQYNFIEQFYKHNWNNPLIVPNLFKLKKFKNGLGYYSNNSELKELPRYGNVGNNLVKLAGYDSKGNGLYVITNKLGLSKNNGAVIEYKFDELSKKSQFGSNNPDNLDAITKFENELTPDYLPNEFNKFLNKDIVEDNSLDNNEQEFNDIFKQENNDNKFDKNLAKQIQNKLQKLYPEIKLNITNNPVWEKGDNIFNQSEYNNQINYRLKAVDILTSDKSKQVFAKGKKNKWDLNKILTELQVPKAQKEIILNKYKDKVSEQEFIKSIFPDTKVNQVVYHSTDAEFDKFDKTTFNTSTNQAEFGKGFYFSNTVLKMFGKNLKTVILNVKNPLTFSSAKDFGDKLSKNYITDLRKGKDGVISGYEWLDLEQYGISKDSLTKEEVERGDYLIDDKIITKAENYNQFIVTEPNQIHILTEEEQSKIYNEDNLREEIITSLLAENSFVVEVNTATENIRSGSKVVEYDSADRFFSESTGQQYYYSEELGWLSNGQEVDKLPEDAEPLTESIIDDDYSNVNTSHYSNLTVPGGTNYTENEIATPDITPNIKGHAQFSTDNGIGWFRSDEQITLSDNVKLQNNNFNEYKEEAEEYLKYIDFNENLDDIEYSEDIKNKIGFNLQYDFSEYNNKVEPYFKRKEEIIKNNVNVLLDEDNKFEQALSENYINKEGSSTRRILELQSDLFQKGRDSKRLITVPEYNSLMEIKENYEDFEGFSVVDMKDGEVISVFPTYELAKQDLDKRAKLKPVPNLTQSEFKQNQFLQLLNKKNNWVTFFVKSIIQDSAKKGYEKVLFPKGDTAAKIEGHQTLEEFKKQKEARIKELENLLKPKIFKVGDVGIETQEDADFENKRYTLSEERKQEVNNEIKQLKQELADVESGQTQLSSIANFYENTITNILKKNGYNTVEITDEYGNKWNEITISSKDLSNILLQRNEANQIIGQANIKAGTVLIDAINQKQDTLPHEYAHHYIAWFRDTPIVKEAIKKWGSEEALVEAIGKQVVKQKGEALNWWNKFVNYILKKIGSLSKIHKEKFVELLTDAFLTRQDLQTMSEKLNLFKDDINDKLNQFKNECNN